MIHVLNEMFGWPGGNVLGNLIASALWAAPALVHLHRKIDRNHAEIMNRKQVDEAAERHPAGSVMGRPYVGLLDKQLIGEVLDRLQGWR